MMMIQFSRTTRTTLTKLRACTHSQSQNTIEKYVANGWGWREREINEPEHTYFC